MANDYKYQNIPLRPTIAAELVFELYVNKGNIAIQEIRDKVLKAHIDRGGLRPTRSLAAIFQEASSYLNKKNKLTIPVTGYWNVHPPTYDKQDNEPTTIVGSGSGNVYLYYYPKYKADASKNNSPVWECKIGSTKGDPYHRVKEQIDKKTGLPEDGVIGLIIKTDDYVDVEKRIQNVLVAENRKVDSPGKEWFLTSPNEVKRIYETLLSMNTIT
ncbi:MAG: GIY-YIG nuclease family protein [Gemmatimonadetes bacterium]|nr:GIY-YIG nuclease family protein [Gemmatimonadota bacterium]